MGWLMTKYLATAAVVVAISELARRSDRLGALVTALPLVTIMALVWMHFERQPVTRIASYAQLTFWYVLPTLPFFLALPAMLPRLGFWPSLGLGMLLTVACFALLTTLLRRFGIELL